MVSLDLYIEFLYVIYLNNTRVFSFIGVCLPFYLIGGCYSFITRNDKGICFTFSVALTFLYLCQITSCSSLNLSVHWLLINMWNISLSTDWYCHLNIYSCMLKMNHVVLLFEFCLLGSISWQNHHFHVWVLNFLNT